VMNNWPSPGNRKHSTSSPEPQVSAYMCARPGIRPVGRGTPDTAMTITRHNHDM
jgi:hypothetical protein